MPKRSRQTSTFRRFFESRFFLFVALGVAILIAVSYARAYYQDYAIKEEIQQLEEQVRSLEKNKMESLELLRYVSSAAYVEEKARTELNLKRTGEHVLVIAENEEDVLVGHDKEEQSIHSLNNTPQWWYAISRWWRYFAQSPTQS